MSVPPVMRVRILQAKLTQLSTTSETLSYDVAAKRVCNAHVQQCLGKLDSITDDGARAHIIKLLQRGFLEPKS